MKRFYLFLMVCLLGLGASAQTPVKVSFPMTDATNSANGVNGSIDIPDVLGSAVLEYGAKTQLNRIRKYAADGSTAASFTVPKGTSAENSDYSVSFVLTPASGVLFQPTNVSFKTGGSKSGNLQFAVKISNSNGESETLQSKTSAAKNSEDGTMTSFNKKVSSLTSSNSAVTVTIFLLTKDSSKDRELMIFNVEVTGEYIVEGGSVYTKLDPPVISADNEANVTITASADASSIKYTIDGSGPSADNGEVYNGPFKVADATIVKAIALGNVDNLILDSEISEVCVYDNSITVATPVIKQQNGTVGIYCSTANATVEYSLDNVTWTAYARPFTLSENATVYARASRANCTDSEVASLEVNSVIPPVEGATAYYVGFGSFPKDGSSLVTTLNADGFPEAVTNDPKLQVTGDNGETLGFSLILERADGKIQTASKSVKFTDSQSRTAFKTSGWKPYRIVLPYNLRAVRVELASFINGGSAETSAYWGEVNGVKYGVEIPMGATSNDYDPADTRVYDLRDSKGNGVKSFNFNGLGQQLGVAVKVEAVPFNLYFVGNDNKWNPKDENYKFTTTDGVTYTLTLPDGISSDWKICNGTWDWNFGAGASTPLNEECDVWFNSSSNFDLKTSGETTITFTLVEGSDVQNSPIASRIKVEGQPFVEPTVHSIYFAGVQTDWDTNMIEFTKNDNDIYVLTLDEGIKDQWKIVCDNNWFGLNGDSKIVPFERYCLGGGNNIDLTTPGKTTIEVEVVEGVPYATVKTSGFDAIYFDNTDSQWTAPHAYIWKSATETGDPFKNWPGIAMSKVPAPAVVTYAVEKDIYDVAVPMYKGYDMVIFNNGSDEKKTGDLELVLEHVYKADGTHEVYNGTTGVDEIAVDDANVAPVYYNLQGARVQNPANGAYIMVRGSKVTKVIR